MYTYGCTPVCVNQAVDMGVYEFQKDLIDAVIEKAFVRDESCQGMTAAWQRFGERMVPAVQRLLASPAPILAAAAALSSFLDEDGDIGDGAFSADQDNGSSGDARAGSMAGLLPPFPEPTVSAFQSHDAFMEPAAHMEPATHPEDLR